MAKQGSDGGQKKAFSSRLMQMKFMKRGQDNGAKETTAAAAATAAPPQQVGDSLWFACGLKHLGGLPTSIRM